MSLILYAIDELTYLINAAALIRPSKSVIDMEFKSTKKMEAKELCKNVNRKVIEETIKGAYHFNPLF